MRLRLVTLAAVLVVGIGGSGSAGGSSAPSLLAPKSVQPIEWKFAGDIVASLCPDAYPHPMQGLKPPPDPSTVSATA